MYVHYHSFCFSSRRRHTRYWRDWSSDVCSSDLQFEAEDRVAVASNWRLVWWRFRRHHLAMASAGLLIFLYLIVLVPDFFSKIGRASCRERVYLSVLVGSFKNTTKARLILTACFG